MEIERRLNFQNIEQNHRFEPNVDMLKILEMDNEVPIVIQNGADYNLDKVENENSTVLEKIIAINVESGKEDLLIVINIIDNNKIKLKEGY